MKTRKSNSRSTKKKHKYTRATLVVAGLLSIVSATANRASAQLVPAACSVPTQIAAGFPVAQISEDVVVNCDMLLWDSTTRDKMKVIAYSKRNFPSLTPAANVYVEDWNGHNLTINLPPGSSRADVALADGLDAHLPVQPGAGPQYRVVVAYQIQTDGYYDVWQVNDAGLPSMNASFLKTGNLNTPLSGQMLDTFHNGPHIDMWSDRNVLNASNGEPTMHKFAIVWTQGGTIPTPVFPYTMIAANDLYKLTEDLNASTPIFPVLLGSDVYQPDVACVTDLVSGGNEYLDIVFTNAAKNTLEFVEFNETSPVLPTASTRGLATPLDNSFTFLFPRIEALSQRLPSTPNTKWYVAVSKGLFATGNPLMPNAYQVYGYDGPGSGTLLSPAPSFTTEDVKSPCVAAGTGLTPSGSFGTGTLIFGDSYVTGFFPRTTTDIFVRAKNVGSGAPFYTQWWQVNCTPVNYNWDASRSFHISTCSNSGWDLLAAWYDGADVLYKTSTNNTAITFRKINTPNEQTKSSGLQLASSAKPFPNPTNNLVYLHGSEGSDYFVRDITGKVCSNGKIPVGGRIDFSNLLPGFYSLQVVRTSGSIEVFKIQKQ